MIEINIPAASKSLVELCQILQEGDHRFGEEATRAAMMLVQWPDSDCPWFVPGPTPSACLHPADFRISVFLG